MPGEQSLIDPRFNGWVVRVWLNFVDDTTQFKSVTARRRFEDAPRGNTEESLLGIHWKVF
jgi:hypothetical protein